MFPFYRFCLIDISRIWSGANGEQGSADHSNCSQPNSPASRLHREGREAPAGEWWSSSRFNQTHTQVVYDLEKRKRVKLLRCAEFRTLEVIFPSGFTIFHLHVNFLLCSNSMHPGCLTGFLPWLKIPAGTGGLTGPPTGLLLLGEREGGRKHWNGKRQEQIKRVHNLVQPVTKLEFQALAT